MTDTPLQVAARILLQEMIQPLRQQLVGRKVIAKNPAVVGKGIYNVDVNTVTEMGAATIDFELPRGSDNRDMIKVTRANKQIPILKKSFEIPRQDFDVWQRKGIPIDTAAAVSAAHATPQDYRGPQNSADSGGGRAENSAVQNYSCSEMPGDDYSERNHVCRGFVFSRRGT